ncbi:MAG TPA: DsrE family protein [Fibrobacteria bacterium]|nr:DsrE family protein [Fibrobacteria bacterium]
MNMPKARGKSSLAIIEKAFRGAVEEQYGHIVWLSRVVRKMGGRTSLLLKGDTVLFAVRGQPRQSLPIGEDVLEGLPHYETTLERMAAEGVPLFAFAPDLRRLGIAADRLMPGVAPVELDRLASLCGESDAVWFW